MLAVIAPPRVVEMADLMDVRHFHAAALPFVIADSLGQRSAPGVRADEERHGTLIADLDLIQSLARDIGEFANQAVAEIRSDLFQWPLDSKLRAAADIVHGELLRFHAARQAVDQHFCAVRPETGVAHCNRWSRTR